MQLGRPAEGIAVPAAVGRGAGVAHPSPSPSGPDQPRAGGTETGAGANPRAGGRPPEAAGIVEGASFHTDAGLSNTGFAVEPGPGCPEASAGTHAGTRGRPPKAAGIRPRHSHAGAGQDQGRSPGQERCGATESGHGLEAEIISS